MTGQKIIYVCHGKSNIQLIATSKGANRTQLKDGYIYESLDITNESEVEAIFKKHQPDAVINTAAFTNVDACETKRGECKKLNVEAVEYLIKSCEKYNAHLIHLSTDFVFNGENGPYIETDTPEPQSYYAQSKYDSEQLLIKSKIKWTIIRTIIIYGVVDDNSRSNLVLWVKNNLEKKQKINVISDQFRSPTLAEDLAGACINAALKKATGIYHVSGKELMSIIDIAKIVADFFGLDASHINSVTSAQLNQPAKRPPVTGFILTKAKHDLDYHPKSFLEGLNLIKSQLEKF